MPDTIIGIDPGSAETALVRYDNVLHKIDDAFKKPNAEIRGYLDSEYQRSVGVAIEMIASYGMAVGKEVFDTCVDIGRLVQICEERDLPWTFVYRKEVKLHVCESPKANDSNIRYRLIEIFGPPGTKKNPGKTYGLKADMWSALAVAYTASFTKFQ